MNDPVITYENVSILYGTHEVIKDISFTVKRNDFLNIVGPNGAGKTTLIKSLIDEIKVDNGKKHMACQRIGYVPQRQDIKRHFPLSVKEFLYTGFESQKLIISKADEDLMKNWLERMNLDKDLIHKKMNHLSGGELQRVHFIRALVAKPDLLILDEPASALDPNFREKFYDILKEIRKEEQLTIIHITHDLTDVILKDSLVMYIDREIKYYGSYENFHEFEHEGHHHG
ncbi:ATP-binding cassette domain-containing protein [Acholeplasma equirhinis]|uniref:metal ABC transporter ATP-binding protein n=1 Tax=Acholeplasma equirhinis TaxID=555393 RepID=UPI00197A77CF|nr:ATP-binding cassette domain-containing protein [Acholeplasma equirhinis]MBN3489941.1 ATP-binding cassette domain-containing protein [Acholeplasma equirhinis]